MHLGAGLTLYQLDDHAPDTSFSDSSIGLNGLSNPGGRFPTIGGLCVSGAGSNTSPCTGTGGMMNMGPGVGGISAQSLTKQMTPTYQASFTWVKGNHTYKFGSEVRDVRLSAACRWLQPTERSLSPRIRLRSRTTNRRSLAAQTVGFPYASFLLGLVNSGTVNPPADLRTGKAFLAFSRRIPGKLRAS